MKGIRAAAGPFGDRPYFKLSEIEAICLEELRASELLPSHPAPIRVERFIERRFGITPQYVDLPSGLLGFTRFTENGVQAIFVAKALDREGTRSAERRLRTTLAHESGHGLLHSHLFALGRELGRLFEDEADGSRIMCRDIPGEAPVKKGYDGRWWEFQANQVMGALLLPVELVREAMAPYMLAAGSLGQSVLDESRRQEAARALSDVFDVNPVVAKIRLSELFPPSASQQLEL